MAAQALRRRRRYLSWELELDLATRFINIGADGSAISIKHEVTYDMFRLPDVFVVKPDLFFWGRIGQVDFEETSDADWGDTTGDRERGIDDQSARIIGVLVEDPPTDAIISDEPIWVSPEDVILAEWGPTVYAVLRLQRAYRVQRCNHFRAARNWRHARRTREWMPMLEDAVAIAWCHVHGSGRFVRKSKIETINYPKSWGCCN